MGKAPVPILSLYGICQHPLNALEAVLFDHALCAFSLEVHPVKIPADRFLNGVFARDVLPVALTPQEDLVPASCFLAGIGVDNRKLI
ncbi:hypothetical protein SDC9_139439 [bioreactor metagenome]|uniref:Uncharacterized protein n=1 Tax=bioreactor metagenome TaxID=1076179 RepID=A0A645DS51_9ZZZZ